MMFVGLIQHLEINFQIEFANMNRIDYSKLSAHVKLKYKFLTEEF